MIIDSHFSPNSSPERKHGGLLLLEKVMATAPSKYLKDIFTTNTVLVLVNHLKVDERYLHRSATKVMQALQSRAKRDPSIVCCAFQGLILGTSGFYNFDTLTKTKTVAKLLAAADLSTFHSLVPAVRGAIERPQAVDDKQADARRRVFADILVTICARALAMTNNESDSAKSVAEMVLDALIGPAYSNKAFGSDDGAIEPPPSSQCREYLRSRVRTCLDQSSQHRIDLLRHIVRSLKVLHEQGDCDQVSIEFDEQTRSIVETAWKKFKKTSTSVGLANPTVMIICANLDCSYLERKLQLTKKNPLNSSKCSIAWPYCSSTMGTQTRLEYCKNSMLINTAFVVIRLRHTIQECQTRFSKSC